MVRALQSCIVTFLFGILCALYAAFDCGAGNTHCLYQSTAYWCGKVLMGGGIILGITLLAALLTHKQNGQRGSR